MNLPSAPQAPEVIEVSADADEVRCDGGNGALGHPLVWYTFDGRDRVECGYCDRLFLKKPLKAYILVRRALHGSRA